LNEPKAKRCLDRVNFGWYQNPPVLPEIRTLATKLVIKELPGHSKNLPPADLCRNYKGQEPARSKSQKEGISTISRIGNTPLILAVKDGNLEKVKSLIAEGADIDASDIVVILFSYGALPAGKPMSWIFSFTMEPILKQRIGTERHLLILL
jgi:hypothetical protein